MKNHFSLLIILMALAIMLLPLSSCTDEYNDVIVVEEEPQVLETRDLTEAFIAAARVKYEYSKKMRNSAKKGASNSSWGYPMRYGQAMLDQLSKEDNVDYGRLIDHPVMKLVREHTNASKSASIDWDSSNLMINMMYSGSVPIDVVDATMEMIVSIEAACNALLIQSESDPSYDNNESTAEMKSVILGAISPYRNYSNSNMSSSEVQAVRTTANTLATNIDNVINSAKDEFDNQRLRWKPKKLFGKILQAVVNVVVVVVVCTAVGVFGGEIDTPDSSGNQTMYGPFGGLIAGIAWGIWMIRNDEYLI